MIRLHDCRGGCLKRLANRNGARPYNYAFTVLELLIVISIIIVLAGLILATTGYVQKKGARSRSEAEIAAMSAALESYKADNGIYPSNSDTYALDARMMTDSSSASYQKASLYLYESLYGVIDGGRNTAPTSKTYLAFKPNMLLPAPPSSANITAIRDPFGNSYGYSTAANPDASGGTPNVGKGYNPTFDLWSTANSTDPNQWVKNW